MLEFESVFIQSDIFGRQGRRGVAVLTISSISVLLTSCSSPAKVEPPSQAKSHRPTTVDISQEALRLALRDFGDRFALTIESAADEISAKTDDRGIRRQTVRWKIRSIVLCRELLLKEDPRVTSIDLWAFCAQIQQYLSHGDGNATFGPLQPIAVAASNNVMADIEALSESALTPAVLDKIRSEMAVWVERNPLRGPMARPSDPHWTIGHSREAPWRSMLTMTSAINPLQGIDEAKQRAEEIKQQIERGRLMVKHLPQQIRWETELMLYDLEDRQTISSALSSFEKLADSFDRLATEADTLPTQLRTETTKALDDWVTNVQALQSTFSEIRGIASDTSQALNQAERVADSVQRAAAGLTETAQAWEGAADSVRQFVPKQNNRQPNSKPFDINEYTKTAESLTAAAIELRGLADDLNMLSESGALATAIESTHSSGRGLVDHLAWRLLQLVVAVLLVAIIYRVVTNRLTLKGNR